MTIQREVCIMFQVWVTIEVVVPVQLNLDLRAAQKEEADETLTTWVVEEMH